MRLKVNQALNFIASLFTKKYRIKKIQMSRFINTELKSDSDSNSELQSDSEAESKSDTELMVKLKSDSDSE